MAVRNNFRLGPLSVARMFWKRKILFLLIWIVASGIGVAVVLRLPTIYRADTVIMVESQRIPEKFVTSTVNADLRDRLSTLSQQILSYRRLLEIIEKYDLYHDERKTHVQEEIVEMMRGDIGTVVEENWMSKSRADSRPSAFRVSFQGVNPTVVAMVANQLGNLFIDENLKAREEQAQGTSVFLETQLSEANRRLEEQEAKLSEFKLKYNGELPEQENALIASISQLQVRLQGMNDAAERAEQNKQLLEMALSSARASQAALTEMLNPTSATTESASGLSSTGEPMRNSERLQRQLDQLRLHYTDNAPPVKALIKLVERTRQEEEAEVQATLDLIQKSKASAAAERSAAAKPGAPQGSGNQPTPVLKNARSVQLTEALIRERERMDSLLAQQGVATSQIESLATERKEVLARIAEAEKRVGQLPVREQQMVALKRDYEISKLNYQSLLDKKLSAEMSTEMERRQKSERFAIVDAARVPEKPVKPNRPLLGALSAALGLALALVLSIGPELKNNVLLGEWEFPKGLPVLGRVPMIQPAGVPATVASRPRKVFRLRLGRPALVSWLVLLLLMIAIVSAVGFYFGRIRI
jgi:polysaccharide biosynthesis transport protein